MNRLQKFIFTSLLTTTALLGAAFPAWAQPSLGTASGFSVLSGSALTCTDSAIAGDLGSGGTFANTGCTIAGAMPPATNPAVPQALADLTGAYNKINDPAATPCSGTLLSTITGPVTLLPGVYCTGAALTGAGVLTLDARGDSNAVWIFRIGAALTGTGFSVVMANGGQACKVFWAPGADVTMTTSAFSGNILAGSATGSITLTGGTLAGRALANGAVTTTGANVIGCAALPAPPQTCPSKKHRGHDKGHGECDDGHDGDKRQMNCDDDIEGHGPDSRYPFERKDGNGKK